MNYLTKSVIAERKFVKKRIEFSCYFVNPKYLTTGLFRIHVSYMPGGVPFSVRIDTTTVKKFYDESSD